MQYTVLIERGPTSWGAYIPDLPGCVAVGASREAVEVLIREALPDHLAAMHARGEDVPALLARVRALEAELAEVHLDAERLRSVLRLVAQLPVELPINGGDDPSTPPLTLQQVAQAAIHPTPWVLPTP